MFKICAPNSIVLAGNTSDECDAWLLSLTMLVPQPSLISLLLNEIRKLKTKVSNSESELQTLKQNQHMVSFRKFDLKNPSQMTLCNKEDDIKHSLREVANSLINIQSEIKVLSSRCFGYEESFTPSLIEVARSTSAAVESIAKRFSL